MDNFEDSWFEPEWSKDFIPAFQSCDKIEKIRNKKFYFYF